MDKFLAGRLSLPVNLQFFKGSSSETVRKRDPKSGQHLAMDEAIFNILSPIATRYGGSDIFGGTLPKASTAVQPKQAEAGNNGSGGYWRTYGEESSAGPKREWVSAIPKSNLQQPQPQQIASNGKGDSGGVEDSLLWKNFDIADRQVETVNRNTDDLLGKLPGYLDQSNDTLRKMEGLADNYVNPYGNDAFDEMNRNMMGDISSYLQSGNRALDDAYNLVGAHQSPYGESDFDEYIRKMGETAEYSAGRADKYYDDADFYLGQNKDLATEGTSQALENLVAKMSDSLKSNYQSDAGSLLSNAANRGIINSSVSTRGLSDLSNAMADAASGQYMQGFQALLDNSLKGATTAGGLAQGVVDTAGKTNANYQDIVNSMLGVNKDSLDTLQGKAGVLQNTASGYNQSAGTAQNAYNSLFQNMLGVNENALKTMQTQAGIYSDASAGYNRDYNSGIGSLETYAKLPAQYYQNALAPISPLYNYWKDLTDSYYGHEDFDTIVHNGK